MVMTNAFLFFITFYLVEKVLSLAFSFQESEKNTILRKEG